jgi:hypothetical protein
LRGGLLGMISISYLDIEAGGEGPAGAREDDGAHRRVLGESFEDLAQVEPHSCSTVSFLAMLPERYAWHVETYTSMKAFNFSGLLISTCATYGFGKLTLKYSCE